MFFSLPNLLTFGRLFLIPFIVICFYYDFPHHHGVTASLFLVGAATDVLTAGDLEDAPLNSVPHHNRFCHGEALKT